MVSTSEKISRELEQKYGLLPLEREGGKRTTLGEAQYRNYYFDKRSIRRVVRDDVPVCFTSSFSGS